MTTLADETGTTKAEAMAMNNLDETLIDIGAAVLLNAITNVEATETVIAKDIVHQAKTAAEAEVHKGASLPILGVLQAETSSWMDYRLI